MYFSFMDGVKQYRVVLVDDDPYDLQTLRALAEQTPLLHVAATFTAPASALDYLRQHPADLLVLDIQMPGLSGLDLLRQLPFTPVAILLTASLTGAVEAYQLGVADYLVKPLTPERFALALRRAMPLLAGAPTPALLTLKTGRTTIRLDPAAIRYVEAQGQFCRLMLPEETLLVSHLLSDLAAQLPPAQFVRIHRSYLVAVAAVALVRGRQLYLHTGEVLPVGNTYQANLSRQIGG